MKKTTNKSIKSPAPAIKPAAALKATQPAKPTAKIKPATQPPFVKTIAPTRLVTTITALIDIGFGNTLFIRGEGPGLSWDRGVPLDSAADNKWSITLGESARPVVFKLLVNDITWSSGEDYTVAPGTSITVTPGF